MTKTNFKNDCIIKIKKAIFQTDIKDIEKIIDELDYENKRKETQNMLLLFNIISYKKAQQRFSFACYKRERWSLEHIHAQNENPAETITDDKKRVNI